MNLTTPQSETTRIERFQSLQPGQYWRALVTIDAEGIDIGMVLLLLSIRWVDDKPHTIILRPHPDLIGKNGERVIPTADGNTTTVYFRYDEHRFLLDEFMAKFEFEPDYQKIRADELGKAQGRIGAIQTQLLEAQQNPAILAKVVEDEMSKKASDGGATPETSRAIVAHSQREQALVSGTVANAIGAGITQEGIEALKLAAGREHEIATIKANWIQAKTKEIAGAIQAMTPYFEEQAAAALAATEDVRAYVARLMSGIESLDLYTGKDVTVLTLRQGNSAPKSVPLTFVQKKLLMDEELAVWADVSEMFDFEGFDRFSEAIRTQDGLVDQIFPTQRCVLVMASTRRYIDYQDKWANTVRNEMNKEVFLLVRDGMNVYCVWSPVESHLQSDRLFPSKGENDQVFCGLDGSQVKFEDVAYTDKLAKHEQLALHYKRFLLLSCGLDHRMKLFGDFYDGPQSLDFVSLKFQEQHCRFLHDDDGLGMLPKEQRQKAASWISAKNEHLKSGSRVLCNWNRLLTSRTAPGAVKSDGYQGKDRIVYRPRSKFDIAIAYKDGLSICVDVTVSGRSPSTGHDRTFTCRVDLSKVEYANQSIEDLEYLCLDDAAPEDLHWYIHNRDARIGHLTYIRMFKTALAFISDEREHEARARGAVAALLYENNIQSDEINAMVQRTVSTWRAHNRGKPLPIPDDPLAKKDWAGVLDQAKALCRSKRGASDAISDIVEAAGYLPLRLIVDGNAKQAVYAAPSDDEMDNRLEPHAWVHKITLREGKTGPTIASKKWASLPKHEPSETIIHEWEGAQRWAKATSAFSSLKHKQKTMAILEGYWTGVPRLTDILNRYDEQCFQKMFDDWKAKRTALLKRSRVVRNPFIFVPLGLVSNPGKGSVRMLCAGNTEAHAVLYRNATTEPLKTQVMSAYVNTYGNKQTGEQRFRQGVQNKYPWKLYTMPVSELDDSLNIFADEMKAFLLEEPGNLNPLLSEMFRRWQENATKEGRCVWLLPAVMAGNGHLMIDAAIGQTLPHDFAPTTVTQISLVDKDHNTSTTEKYSRWFDFSTQGEKQPDMQEQMTVGLASLVASAREQYPTLTGYSSTGYKARTQDEAMEIAKRQALEMSPECRLVPASTLPDAPQPPNNIERWFVLDH